MELKRDVGVANSRRGGAGPVFMARPRISTIEEGEGSWSLRAVSAVSVVVGGGSADKRGEWENWRRGRVRRGEADRGRGEKAVRIRQRNSIVGGLVGVVWC